MTIKMNDSQSDFNSLIKMSDIGDGAGSANTTPDIDLLTGTTGTVYTIFIDNTSGSGRNYLKLYDALDVTHGTTTPIFCGCAPASTRIIVYMKQGIPIGTALSVAASDTAGTGASGSNPAGTMNYVIFGG